MDIIKQLKENEKPFGLMSEEMQAKAKEIGWGIDWIGYQLGQWGSFAEAGDTGRFVSDYTYRLRPDYEEKKGVIEYPVLPKRNGQLAYCFPDSENFIGWIHESPCDPAFIGFKYKDGTVSASPRLFVKNGQCYIISRSDDTESYEVLTPTHVLFKEV